MVRKAKPKLDPDDAPQPNPEALRAYAAELERANHPKRPAVQYGSKRTPQVERTFLQGLAEGHSVTTSANAAEIERTTAFEWRRKSEASRQDDGTYKDDFCVRWEAAVQAGVDLLEDEAVRRASKGVTRPVYQQGVMVGTTQEYSDTLMVLLLRGKRREIYNTERHELSGPNGGPIPTAIEIEFVEARSMKK